MIERPAGTGTAVVDNIATDVLLSNGSTAAERHHNLLRRNARSGDTLGAPVFAGGGTPLGYAGFALAFGSPGDDGASDGTDQGARIAGTPTPTPTPTPRRPLATRQPRQTGPRRPASSVGQEVTLDGSASRGDLPMSCTWSFENQSGSTIWETIAGCTIRKAFTVADTKHVMLIVRDADGDTSSSKKSFVVSR